MAHIYVSSVIDAPIDDVWAIARDFTGHWHSSVIYNSSIEDGLPSDRVGCVRAFELSDGGKLRELLVGLSDERHEFSYRILDSPLPVEDYVASVRFFPVTTTGATFGEWIVDFRVPPDEEQSTVDTVRGVFENGFSDLVRLLQS
jgi:Polyketide cyclase / dehydrase and lipid transport